MKILLITSFFPPTHTAGTEKRTFGYAKTLIERGHQVQVLCAGNWEEGQLYWNGYTDDLFEEVPVRRIHLNWKKSPDPNTYLYANPLIQNHLREWLSEWKPDLAHITSCISLSASIISPLKNAGLPIVLTLTDFWFVCHKLSLLRSDGELCNGQTTNRECIQCLGSESGVYRHLNKFLPDQVNTEILHILSQIPAISRLRGLRGTALNFGLRRTYLKEMINLADAITAPSRHLANTLHNTGITNKIQVIQSGHDLNWMNMGIPKQYCDRIRFGYIGQITPSKGLHTLISAFQAGDIAQKAELHIYGDFDKNPTYMQELQSIDGPNNELITYHGSFQHKDLGQVLAGIDILIVPSIWHENNPRVIQEAYAGKTPVIASDVGGISEYVQDETNGLLFKRGDAADLRAQINRIVGEPTLIQRLKLHLPKVKSMDNEVDEFEFLYRSLLIQSEA